MPELPEVETARRHIERDLIGKRLLSVDNRLPKLMRDSPLAELTMLQGAVLVSARRRAKVLSLAFDNDLSLLIHLKLSGQISIHLPGGRQVGAGHPVPKPDGQYPHSATHVDFIFDDGTIAYFSDVRQFGWLRLMPSEDIDAALALFKFGPEGTGDLDVIELGKVFARRGIPVKTLLLDQSFVAGLGNIYVDEVLFRSGVHPSRLANSLKPKQVRAVLGNVPPVLAEGIAIGGAKIYNHRAHPILGFPAVHARAGEPCFVCGAAILKIRVGARGTYLCPRCQPAPRKKSPSIFARRQPAEV